MNEKFKLALQQQLASPSPGSSPSFEVTINNSLVVPITLYYLDPVRNRDYAVAIAAGGSNKLISVNVGEYYLAVCDLTGSYACVIEIADKAKTLVYDVNDLLLCNANDIGPIPQPTSDVIVPSDSPRVLIAAGLTPVAAQTNKPNIVLREQFWQRSNDSYSLAPHETKQVSVTTFSGRTTTTSDEATLTESLNIKTKGGFGAFSAQVSASLTQTTRNSQSITIQDTLTKFSEETMQNTAEQSVLVLKWQIVEVITVFDPAGVPLSCALSNLSPIIASQPYVLSSLPAPNKPQLPAALHFDDNTIAALPKHQQKAFRAFRTPGLLPDAI